MRVSTIKSGTNINRRVANVCLDKSTTHILHDQFKKHTLPDDLIETMRNAKGNLEANGDQIVFLLRSPVVFFLVCSDSVIH